MQNELDVLLKRCILGALMVRTQVFLTEKETRLLSILAREQRVTRSEIIRDALDAKLRISQHGRFLSALKKAAGCLRGHPLKAQLGKLRAQW